MSSPVKKFLLSRTALFVATGILITAVLVLLGINFYNQQRDDARANQTNTDCSVNPVKMAPGDTCSFVLTYTNGQGEPTTNNILTLYVGSELVPDLSSFRDEMKIDGVSQGTFSMNASSLVQSNTQGWGTRIRYMPGSANNANSPSGSSTPGNLPGTVTGTITFRASLKSDVLSRYQVGDILEPPTVTNFIQQGLYGVLTFTETTNPTPGIGKVEIIAPATVSSSSSVSSSVASSSSSLPTVTVTGGSLTGPIGGQPTGAVNLTNNAPDGPATYNNGSCVVQGNVNIGTFLPTSGQTLDASCPVGPNTAGSITLSGGAIVNNVPSNFTNQASSSSSSVSSVASSAVSSSSSATAGIIGGQISGPIGGQPSGSIVLSGNIPNGSATYTNGTNCTVSGIVTNNVFVPSGTIPSGCPTGPNTNGTLTVPGGTVINNVPANFTQTTTATGGCADKFGNDCRLYFIGANNAAVNWDASTQFNLNWDPAQKFKDGDVKLVFDNIKLANGSQIINGSACVFTNTRYGFTPVLFTYNTTTNNGSASVTFPINDQTVNYHTIIVTCTDSTTNEVVKDYDRLVLPVGAQGQRTGPVVTP